jgi:hypothetical protein
MVSDVETEVGGSLRGDTQEKSLNYSSCDKKVVLVDGAFLCSKLSKSMILEMDI